MRETFFALIAANSKKKIEDEYTTALAAFNAMLMAQEKKASPVINSNNPPAVVAQALSKNHLEDIRNNAEQLAEYPAHKKLATRALTALINAINEPAKEQNMTELGDVAYELSLKNNDTAKGLSAGTFAVGLALILGGIALGALTAGIAFAVGIMLLVIGSIVAPMGLMNITSSPSDTLKERLVDEITATGTALRPSMKN